MILFRKIIEIFLNISAKYNVNFQVLPLDGVKRRSVSWWLYFSLLLTCLSKWECFLQGFNIICIYANIGESLTYCP